jgi:uncharacterized membrane protein
MLVIVYGYALQHRRRHPTILADPQKRRGYLRLLLLGAILVILDGWLGGYLVYTLRLGVGR